MPATQMASPFSQGVHRWSSRRTKGGRCSPRKIWGGGREVSEAPGQLENILETTSYYSKILNQKSSNSQWHTQPSFNFILHFHSFHLKMEKKDLDITVTGQDGHPSLDLYKVTISKKKYQGAIPSETCRPQWHWRLWHWAGTWDVFPPWKVSLPQVSSNEGWSPTALSLHRQCRPPPKMQGIQ